MDRRDFIITVAPVAVGAMILPGDPLFFSPEILESLGPYGDREKLNATGRKMFVQKISNPGEDMLDFIAYPRNMDTRRSGITSDGFYVFPRCKAVDECGQSVGSVWVNQIEFVNNVGISYNDGENRVMTDGWPCEVEWDVNIFDERYYCPFVPLMEAVRCKGRMYPKKLEFYLMKKDETIYIVGEPNGNPILQGEVYRGCRRM